MGTTLVVVSCILYAAILAVPWIVDSTGERLSLSAGLAIGGEAAFWLGALVAGPAVVRRFRNRASPTAWFRRRSAEGRDAHE